VNKCNQTGIVYGDPVIYEDETYQTVVICDQTWMARDLNYKPSTGNYRCDNFVDYCNSCFYDYGTAYYVCPLVFCKIQISK
jgi:uncharacterized protein (TIGR02145 family)